MKISACYITKNEAKNLPESLNSIKESVDEIVVVDTGSTDNTKEIAYSYGAKVSDYKWHGDFAAARNAAIKQATGDWILFLDADEYFTTETRQNLRQAIENQLDKEALVVKLINLDVEDEVDKEIDSTFVLRIFRRKPEIFYERRIHEYVKKDSVEPLKLGAVPENVLLIHHTGYTPSRSGRKAKRNLELLLEEIKVSQEPQNLYRYLAEAYDGLGETDKAIYYAELDIADGPKPIAYASRCYRMLLLRLNDEKKRRKVLHKAIKDFPLMPEFHAEEAEYLAKELDYEQALQEMKKAVELYDSHVEDGESMQFNTMSREQAVGRIKSWKSLLDKAAELNISSCLMVRDAAGDIESWLEHARVYSDEIIIVDTGSCDRTKEICCEKGYEPISIEWQDDFSIGRNIALDRAKGDWVIFLDVDEYFREPGKVRNLLAKAESQSSKVEGIMLPLVNIDEDAYDCEISRFNALRVWRNRQDYRYEGAIHEALYCKGQSIKGLVRAEYPEIMHTGYSTQRVRAKLERNLRMLLKEIEINGDKPLYARYMADCCYGLKEYGLAEYYAKKALASGVKTLAGDGELYSLWENSMAELGKDFTERYAVVAQGRSAVPADIELQVSEGLLLLAMGKNEQGQQILEKVVSNNLKSNTPSTSAKMLQAITQLAEIKTEIGDLEKAGNLLDWVLVRYPGNDAALDVYATLLRRQGKNTAEIAALLQDKANVSKDWSAWAWKTGQLRLAKYFAGDTEIHEHLDLQKTDWTRIEKETYLRVAASVQDLFMELLSIKTSYEKKKMDWIEEWCRILPDSWQPIVKRYYGSIEQLDAKDEEAYLMGWNILLQRGNAMALASYSRIAIDFEEAVQLKIADDLWQQQEWEAAIFLYQGITQEGIKDCEADYWYHLGTACYYLQEDKALVRECLTKAKTAGCQEKALSAYWQWTKE